MSITDIRQSYWHTSFQQKLTNYLLTIMLTSRYTKYREARDTCALVSSHCPPLTVALGDDIGLDVAVVVFARPDEAAGRLEHLRHHVVDEPVLVPDAQAVELRLVAPERAEEERRDQTRMEKPCRLGGGRSSI